MIDHDVAEIQHRHERLAAGENLGVGQRRQKLGGLNELPRSMIIERRRLHFSRYAMSELGNVNRAGPRHNSVTTAPPAAPSARAGRRLGAGTMPSGSTRNRLGSRKVRGGARLSVVPCASFVARMEPIGPA